MSPWICWMFFALVLGFFLGRLWEYRSSVVVLEKQLNAVNFKASEIRQQAWREGFDEGRASEREFLTWRPPNVGGRR